MTSRSTPPSAKQPLVRLPALQDDETQPRVCPSTRYLWDEEIELVRQMREIKLEVREARARGQLDVVDRLRTRFQELDAQREKIRRARLDSQGWPDYD